MAISISMPLRFDPYGALTAGAFFSGLLPDDIVRHRLARYLGVSERNPFALLEAIGGECAGALCLYPQNQTPPPENDNAEYLDDQKLKKILTLLKRQPMLAGDNGLRLSLAGAQDKIAVGIKNNQIMLIRGTTPTTHILKPVISDIDSSVHNEYFCMQLAKLIGIEVPPSNIQFIDDTPYFVITRYDRIKVSTHQISRLHQEDFCQAMSIMPTMKYEREGGPNVQQCQHLLRSVSARPAADQIAFFKRLIFNYLIGNVDAHGKHFALLYTTNKPVLAPAYDLLSTAIYPELSTKMAMKIGSKYQPGDVFLHHWHQLAADTATARKNLTKQLQDLSYQCLKQAENLKRHLLKSQLTSPVYKQIIEIIHDRSHKIIQQCR
jgi:serine/threonine-protein kinase HipA